MDTWFTDTWKCEDCDSTYTTTELFQLDQKPAPAKDRQHDSYPVCECGYVFHRDNWDTKHTVEKDGREYLVSTTYLQWEEQDGMWYETCVFWEEDGDRESRVVDRYETKPEAKDGHKQIMRQILEDQLRI